MTVEEKLGYIGGIDWMYTKSIDRLGIHRMRMSDGPQGIGTKGKSTAYPATVTLAATWNENLAYQYGKALGRASDCFPRYGGLWRNDYCRSSGNRVHCA